MVYDGGSELHLLVNDEKAEGFYITKVTSLEQRSPITGWVNGELIGFVVSWKESYSLTSWCGRYVRESDDRECIKTAWHLGHLFEDASKTIPNPVWSTFITNTSHFYYAHPLDESGAV